MPTVVALNSADSLLGHVVVDDFVQLYRGELTTSLGALSPTTMIQISQGSADRVAVTIDEGLVS